MAADLESIDAVSYTHLPVAFTYESSNMLPDSEEKDEFLYQNQLFSYLSGQNVQVNKRIEAEPKADSNTVGYDVKHMDDPVYGYFNMKDKDGGKVYVDDQYVTLYNTWLCPRAVSYTHLIFLKKMGDNE